VAALVAWLRVGPMGAAVTSSREEPAPLEPGLGSFEIRR